MAVPGRRRRMETVEVLVRIPKKGFEELQSNYVWWGKHGEYIKKGTVLPKGHGDLIDKNKLKEKAWKHIDDTESYSAVYLEDVEDARPVIEADRGKKDDTGRA